jgi:hypothetical protein
MVFAIGQTDVSQTDGTSTDDRLSNVLQLTVTMEFSHGIRNWSDCRITD